MAGTIATVDDLVSGLEFEARYAAEWHETYLLNRGTPYGEACWIAVVQSNQEAERMRRVLARLTGGMI